MIPVRAFSAYIIEEEKKMYNIENNIYQAILNIAKQFLFSIINNETLLKINYNIDKVLWVNKIYCYHADCSFNQLANELLIKFRHDDGNVIYLDEISGKDIFCIVIK